MDKSGKVSLLYMFYISVLNGHFYEIKFEQVFFIKLQNSDSKLCLSKEVVKRNYGVLPLIYSLHHFENFTKKFFLLVSSGLYLEPQLLWSKIEAV